jgi:hypothetical protein
MRSVVGLVFKDCVKCKPTAYFYGQVGSGLSIMIATILEKLTGKDDLERIAYKEDLALLNAYLKASSFCPTETDTVSRCCHFHSGGVARADSEGFGAVVQRQVRALDLGA